MPDHNVAVARHKTGLISTQDKEDIIITTEKNKPRLKNLVMQKAGRSDRNPRLDGRERGDRGMCRDADCLLYRGGMSSTV